VGGIWAAWSFNFPANAPRIAVALGLERAAVVARESICLPLPPAPADLLSRFDRRIPSAFGSAMKWLHNNKRKQRPWSQHRTGPRQCHEEEEEPTACSLRLAAAAIRLRLRLRLLQYFSLYGLQLQQSKQLQQCRLVASRTRPK
jgi:hypothetical protein